MTQGFQQQNQQPGSSPFSKSAATPQHGQKPDRDTAKVKEHRTFQPRPGHG